MTSQQETSTSPVPSAGDGPRMPTIDLLRGTAILLVILYHLDNLIILPGGWGMVRDAAGAAHLAEGSKVLRFLLLPFHMGRVGVNLFFLISGLCIHLRFARQLGADARAPFLPKTFFLRRFFRIYPVYWAALAVGVFAAAVIYPALPSDRGSQPPATGVGIALHAVMLHSFSREHIWSIIGSLWSIATEEQFYLLYPLVFVYLGRRLSTGRIVAGLLVLSLAWRLTLVLSNPPPLNVSDGPFIVWIFGFSLPRYFEWSLGALLAHALATGKTLAETLPFLPARVARARPWQLMLLGLGFIGAGALSLLRIQVKWIVEDPCYGIGWFFIMAALLLPASRQSRVRLPAALAAAAGFVGARLQSLGRRSFSVYLLHEVVLFTTAGLMRRFHLPPLAVAAPLGCALIWAFCYPFYRYIEAPFELRSKMVGKRAAAAVRQPSSASAA